MPAAGTKFIVCLGNPGSQYSTTRHNVGWWLADRAAESWDFGRFRRQGPASVAQGEVDGRPVQIIKPLTYMNRSGEVVRQIAALGGFALEHDLMIVVDDVALDPGRCRLRPSGSAGGHNGLRSIEDALGTREYPRLRIGVGSAPPGESLVDWVLTSPPPGDRRRIQDLFPALVEGLGAWIAEGLDAAMNRINNVPHDRSES